MALRDMYLTPDLSKVYFRMLCREVGLSHIAYTDGKLRFSEQPNGKIYVPALLTLDEFNRVRPRLEQSRYQVVVLLHELAVNTTLKAMRIETIDDLSKAMTLAVERSRPFNLPKALSRETGAFVRVATSSMGNSVLHRTQTMLYRVPKEDRAFTQTAVYAYLAGVVDTIGRAADYSYLLTMIHAPELQQLRKAALLARKTSIEEASAKMNVDKFDLNYLFSRLA